MKKQVVDDWDRFCAFLASQPLCKWTAEKEREVVANLEMVGTAPVPSRSSAKKKDDNADLMAALASMA
jgi:hypothetical protein